MSTPAPSPQPAYIGRGSKPYPDGSGEAVWFEIVTLHGDLEHRSRDHAYKTEADARAAAEARGYEVESEVRDLFA